MGNSEISTQAAKDIAKHFKNSLSNVQFKTAAIGLGGITVSSDKIDEILSESPLIKEIIKNVPDGTPISLSQFATLAMYSEVIEGGNVKAYTALRDTAGEKPVDKIMKTGNAAASLSDEELEYLLMTAEVEEASD